MAKKIQDGNQIVTNVDSNDNLTFSIKNSFIDSTPTVNSTNLVTSGGVKSALDINTTDIAAAVIRIANNETNVNTNTTNIGTLSNLTTTSKTNLVSAINEVNTGDNISERLVSIGSLAPETNEKVWFKTTSGEEGIYVNEELWYNKSFAIKTKHFSSITTANTGYYNLDLKCDEAAILGFRYDPVDSATKLEIYSNEQGFWFIRCSVGNVYNAYTITNLTVFYI